MGEEEGLLTRNIDVPWEGASMTMAMDMIVNGYDQILSLMKILDADSTLEFYVEDGCLAWRATFAGEVYGLRVDIDGDGGYWDVTAFVHLMTHAATLMESVVRRRSHALNREVRDALSVMEARSRNIVALSRRGIN